MSMTPAPNTPLSAGDVELLREGDWLLHQIGESRFSIHRSAFRYSHTTIGDVIHGLDGQTCVNLSRCTFLVRPDQEGWIAHQGGVNPAPGMRVEKRFRNPDYWRGSADHPDVGRWDDPASGAYITHWRPHVPSQAPAAPSPTPSLGVDLGELRRLAEAATQGEWITEAGTDTIWVGPRKANAAKVARVICPVDVGPGYRHEYVEQQTANAAFIAAANPAVILSLISHIEKLENRS